ncbi:MAG TPA: ABC transporter permease [Puia sp.]|nr:ABC transporter permease [Puia sp.]
MLKNYLRIAWRNLWKNKAFSTINIAGLALGLACSLLILLWVQDEWSVDTFHANNSRLFRVYTRAHNGNKISGGDGTPAVLAAELKRVIPDIEYATNFSWNQDHTFQVKDKILKINGNYADADFFNMFSYPLLQGTRQTALNTPVSIAISRKVAADFFGSPAAAIGKTILYENKKNLIVTAVFEMPENSSDKFEFLLNWQNFLDENGWAKDITNSGPKTYVMLRKDANAALVDKKLTNFLFPYNKDWKKAGNFYTELGLQPFRQKYLYGSFTDGRIDGGRIEYVRLFSIVAIFILVIACINFMNLTTARSIKRAKEIGVRKVVGALRSSLIRQFIGESLLLTTIAVAISLFLLTSILPVFNIITQKQIALPFNQLSFWVKLLWITLVTGLIAGSYPALFLSSFKPVKVLKGSLRLGQGVTLFRKGLVVFQFVLSVVLIISTIIISRQVNFIQTQNLGYDRENLVYIPLDGELAGKYTILKDEASRMPGIKMITRMADAPTNIQNGTSGVIWEGKDPNNKTQFTETGVGYDFVPAMKLRLLQGRDYSRSFATDSVGYLVNESALQIIGYKDPIGKPLTFWRKKGTIIGVVKDFHFASLHEPIKPLVIHLAEKDDYGTALIRTMPGQTKEALSSLQKLCKQLNPNFTFSYSFSDEEYRQLYNNEQVIGNLSNAFATLAILISCLGLLGLAMFTAEQRVKEIGIRKVLGASIGSLFALLSTEFVSLVCIAFVIASPIAWFAMHKWLQNYAYHAPIEWWMFVLAGLAALVITLLTISFQAAKAATTNPVKSLRAE